MRGRRKRLLESALVAALTLVLAACAGQPATPAVKPFDGSLAAAEAALGELGAGAFEIVDFAAGEGEYTYLADAFRFGSSLYSVGFDATIRFTRDVRIAARDEIVAQFGSGATVAEVERQLALLRLLGAGEWSAGETQAIHGGAVFEETEDGWRLATVDRQWRLVAE